jgi:hypothetical protein
MASRVQHSLAIQTMDCSVAALAVPVLQLKAGLFATAQRVNTGLAQYALTESVI